VRQQRGGSQLVQEFRIFISVPYLSLSSPIEKVIMIKA
jgi:hypothetical protein